MAAPSRPSVHHTPFYEQLYNHIALPRDVPGCEDRNLCKLEAAILTRLIDATRLLSHIAHPGQQQICMLGDSLTACQSVHIDKAITKPALLRELRGLKPEGMLILHVSAQNCGLLIYTDNR